MLRSMAVVLLTSAVAGSAAPVPIATERLLVGARRLAWRADGPAIRPAGDVDPSATGGWLRLTGPGGDTTIALPADGWRRRGAGWRFALQAPSVRVRLASGRLQILAHGAGLGLGAPDGDGPVQAVLGVGTARWCACAGCTPGDATVRRRPGLIDARDAAAPRRCAPNDAVWPMHTIDDRFRGANALGPGDVNGDGRTDYVTNYEFDQRYVVTMHPGTADDPRRPWPRVTALQATPFALGHGFNSEHAALGDLDGDGALDVIGAQGDSALDFWEGHAPGVRVVWGPPAASVLDASAWQDGGRIPATVERGHYLFVRAFDVDGDGAQDVLAGGRLQDRPVARRAGLVWIAAPPPPADRRNLALWSVHDIAPDAYDGHGFVLVDMDGDGDQDLADATADFDTPEDQEQVLWYENPGPGTPAQRDPWPQHELHRSPAYDGKPQLAVGDLDGDGRTDLVTQTRDALQWFRRTADGPVFERIAIPKAPMATFFSRPTRLVDLDGDGRLDVWGMLSHEQGELPFAQASAFWMEWTGDAPGTTGWATHAAKWGPGRTARIDEFGEKWDQVDVTDVDGDGDPDVVANCEEWWAVAGAEVTPFYTPGLAMSTVAVVWFENRLGEMPRVAVEGPDGCAVEAEEPTDMDDGTWVQRARYDGFTGTGYLQAHNALDEPAREADATAGVRWRVQLRGGRYAVWARVRAPGAWGYGLGGAASDSAWLRIDGGAARLVDDAGAAPDVWRWVRVGAPVRLAPGLHDLVLRVREHGMAVDRLWLGRGPTAVPADVRAGRP